MYILCTYYVHWLIWHINQYTAVAVTSGSVNGRSIHKQYAAAACIPLDAQ